MRQTTFLAALVLILAVPAAAQETVIGFLEPPLVDGCRPEASNCERQPGVIRVFGWALASSGVRKVTIQVDGSDIGQASHGGFRPLVQDLHPFFPDSAGAGFGYHLNGSDFQNGLHDITAKVETYGGTTLILPAVDEEGTILSDGVQRLFWSYNTTVLHPFGKIERPHRNAELYGTCDRNNPFRRYSPVSGWALDLGVETGDAGIGWVELLVDGSLVGNSRLNCRFNILAGGLTNCYGLPRLDIERSYPFAVDAPNSGFRFVLDVGFLLDNGWAEGHHTLTIRAGDISNQNANVSEIPVTFFCLENLPNQSAFGRIESPQTGRFYAGLTTFQGWALDGEGVARVDLFVDGAFIGEADYGPGQGTRPGVLEQFPGFPDSLAPVWRLRDFDTTTLADGFRQLQVRVTDFEGQETIIGEVTFRVNNVED